ncbi:MAG: MBL fold metallo-hydrolase [Candidatus Geothermincolia bacterium]
MIKLGELELHSLTDGLFRLDGGSMFGVIPRSRWESQKPPDGANRINLALNSLLVRTSRGNILLETGIGEKLEGKDVERYDLRRSVSLLDSLAASGCGPDDIDYVIISHLHLDHAGWATRRDGDEWLPTFPRAKYLIQQREWDAASDPDPRSRPSYDERNFAPLEQAGRLGLLDGETHVMPEVTIYASGGHTAGHQVTCIESGGERLWFPGDMVPTLAHLRTHWHMSWDLFPLDVMRRKERMLREAARRGDLLFLTHEDSGPLFRMGLREGAIVAEPQST